MGRSAKTYRSDALRSVHLAVQELAHSGVVDKATKRHFDVACLTSIPELAPEDIRRIREQSRMSQAIFALALNVSAQIVSKWERGEKKPSGPSLKLLSLAAKNGIEAIL